MAEILYGIRKSDGKVVSITDIPVEMKGLKCDCYCPSCQKPLEACSLQGKVSPYFRHYSEKTGGKGGGSSGCDVFSSNESALHLMAKEILVEEKKIFVPAEIISLKQVGISELPSYIKAKIKHKYECQKAELIECRTVDLEKPLQGFIPDASIDTHRGEILVEVFVTHDIKPEKKEKLKVYGVPTLKIDLSEFVDSVISRNDLRKIIVAESNLKEWAYYPISNDELQAARQYYENIPEVKQYYKEQSQLKKEARIREEKRVKREKKLTELLEPENYNAELVRLRNDEEFYKYAEKEFLFYKVHKKKPWFIDIPITGEMIFQCDRRIWQGIIFDRFIYNRKKDDAKFNYLGDDDNPSIFNKLVNQHNIPVDYDLTYKITYHKNFNDVLWFRVEVIATYIRYLEMLGFIVPETINQRYNQPGWEIVKARRTIEPPDKEAANLLFELLKKADRRSPRINNLIANDLNGFFKKRLNDMKRAREEERKQAEAQRQAEREAQIKAQREAAEAATKKRREDKQREIETFDFNQNDKTLFDLNDFRLLLCTSCNKICKGPQIAKRDTLNINKCLCRSCYVKSKV